MKIFSEFTNKEYETVEACLEAEKAYEAQQKLEKEKKEKLDIERKERATEIEKAYEDIRKAEAHFLELRDKFIKDYGYFHMTYTNRNVRPQSPMENFLKVFF